MNRFCRLAAFLVAAAPLAASPALAHPHVWVDAKAEVVFDAKGEITAIRHIWQFDPEFTAYATLNLDANNDGELSEAELEPLAQTNMDALGEYGFFTGLYVANKKVAFAKPTEYWLDFHEKRLTLFYTLPLAKPLPLHGAAMLEVGDPEYFVAISFIKNAEVHLEGAPKGCTATYRPPRDLDAQTMAILGSIPADQHDLPPDLVQAASVLSNVINLNCPKAVGDAGTAAAPVVMPEPRLSPADTLTAADTAIAEPDAIAPPPPVELSQAEPAPPVELSQAEPAPQTEPAPEPTIEPDAMPPPEPPTPGFFEWLGGLWHNIFG